MRYLYIKWVHKNPNDPVHLYSEIDAQSYERRKVEIYADGRKGFADESEQGAAQRSESCRFRRSPKSQRSRSSNRKKFPQRIFRKSG